MGHELSIVIPVYNEQENVEKLTGLISAAMADLAPDFWEVIFVDDGSADETLPILRRMAKTETHLRILSFSENQGQSAAFDAGIRAVHGKLIVTMDGDLQNDPRDIASLLGMLDEEVGCVCGVRVDRRDNFVRRMSSRIANGIRNWLSQETITDTGCSLKVFRKECFDHIVLYEGFHRFFPTLVKMEGFKVVETPVRHHPRFGGQSKYGVWNRLFKSLYDLIVVRWMKRRKLRYQVTEIGD